MSKHNLPDERVVYLKLKNIFKGQLAEVRQPRAISKLIKQNKEQEEVAELIRAHDLDVICNTARSLLTEQVFTSTLKAKIRFPELFDISPTQSAARAASEFEAARNDANAIRDARDQPFGNSPDSLAATLNVGRVETLKVPLKRTASDTQIKPQLFPVYLPFRTQHQLLCSIQETLETACFRFGQQKMPEVIEKNGWDCPEAAELNQWAVEFTRNQTLFADKETQNQNQNQNEKSLEKLFRSISDIRHTAVHRIRMSAKGLQQFIAEAESLAALLDDAECQASLTTLRQKTQFAVEELERNKHILSSKLDDTLKSIKRRRVELDHLEAQLLDDIVKEDEDYRALAGANLEQAIFPCRAVVGMTSSITDVGAQSIAEESDSVDDFEHH